ncbi:MAG: hypothetical protein K2X03_01430 [Bryobacteraceae bacterium]|nr:hypothetical protein [Bryobacteraceae bacterium]
MTSREQRFQRTLAWAICAILWLTALTWLGARLLQQESGVPPAYWAVVVAALAGMAVWGRSLRGGRGAELRPVRLREAIQASLRRTGVTAMVHEGGDPYVAAEPEVLAYVLDRLLQASANPRLELRSEGKAAIVMVRGAALEDPLGRRIVEAQGGEMLRQDDGVKLRWPLVS